MPKTTSNPVYTVSQLNRLARNTLEDLFTGVVVEGEISELLQHRSGHWYFTLKDEQSQLRVAMFRGANQRVRFSPANGDLIQLTGQLSVYEARGSYQFIASKMAPAGEGKLQMEFERLKALLAKEGLFDNERKRELPPFPRQVALVTSPQGAAIDDMLSTFARRSPGIELVILPVAVQGNGAAEEIAAAIDTANRITKSNSLETFQPDVLIVGRGGGSLEDLWAFNEEVVARAIYSSKIPVVSAVGHEIDFSIADMVADVRAATPTAAAELVAPDQQHTQQRLNHFLQRLTQATNRSVNNYAQLITSASKRLQHPSQKIQQQSMRLDHLDSRLVETMNNRVQTLNYESDHLQQRLTQQSPDSLIRQLAININHLNGRFKRSIKTLLDNKERDFSRAAAALDIVSPLGTLHRGFSITHINGEIVRSVKQIEDKDEIVTKLQDGEITAVVTNVAGIDSKGTNKA